MQTRSFYRSLLQRCIWSAFFCYALCLVSCSSAQPAPSHLSAPVDRPIPTTGCGKTPTSVPGTSVLETLRSTGISRTYLLHLPTGYQREHRQPLILYFHSSSRPSPTLLSGEEQMSGFSVLADREDVITVYPLGTM